MRDFEVGKLLKVGKFEVSDAPNSLSDSFIKGDDSAVYAGVSDCEQVNDIFSIAREFLNPVGECEDGRSNGPIPRNRPISPILNDFRGLDGSERDFEVSKFLDFGIVMGGG